MDNVSVNIAMTVAHWNVVMGALGQRPFAEVADIINIIKAQADAQLSSRPTEEPEQAE